jgi:hypothetical protein
MWFVPPDIGSRVLVIFAEGGEVFWIGCIPEKDVNFQIPASDAVTTFHKDNANVDKKLPVSEINKKNLTTADVGKIDATEIQKEVNRDFAENLVTRGLDKDETRGLTTSSARRETPSKVFGISTPGPYDRRPNAPTVSYGSGQVYHNRLGGSSIVMDDGDESLFRKGSPETAPSEYADRKKQEDDGDVTIPHNEMLRLKTRTGHQILMHNSEDLIYIGNSRGTAWIELTSNGKIDIYSEDSISVHTKTDINFKADRDINFEAGRDFNVKAFGDSTREYGGSQQVIIGNDNKVKIGDIYDVQTQGQQRFTSVNSNTFINSKGDNKLVAGGDIGLKAGNDHIVETGNKSFINSKPVSIATPDNIDFTFAFNITGEPAPLTTWKLPADNDETIETILRRVPQHEPWTHHENLAPLNFTPTETDIKKPEEQRDQGITPFPPAEGEYKMTADTFRKGT